MDGHAEECVERCCELAHTTVDQLHQVSTPCLDDHQVKPKNLKIVGELSATCSLIVLKACIWQESEDQIYFGQRNGTERAIQSHSFHIQLQTVVSRSEPSNKLQTGIIPRRRFCRKFDGLKVNLKPIHGLVNSSHLYPIAAQKLKFNRLMQGYARRALNLWGHNQRHFAPASWKRLQA